MDAALKARNLGSASVRRQRIQERKVQQHIAHEERVNRKKQLITDMYSLDGSDDESEHSSSSSPDLDFMVDTPLEPMLQTPQDMSSSDLFITLSPTAHDLMPGSLNIRKKPKEPGTITSGSLAMPKMQATLTTIADWNYDRFSVMIDPSEVEDLVGEVEDESVSSSSDEDLEEYSPIEIATPVLYTMPKTRPSMVSILSVHGQGAQPKPLKVDTTIVKRPTIRRHVSEQLLSGSPRDLFKAGEAKMFQSSNSSRETLNSMNSSSYGSQSLSLASQTDLTISKPVSQTSQSDQSTQRSPKRKSSLPLLFGGNKGGHSRMSSIKKFMRSSTLGPPMTVATSVNGHVQRQASSSTLETHFESRDPSIEISRSPLVEQPNRPPTVAETSSPQVPSADTLTALPIAESTSASTEAISHSQVSQPALGNEEVQMKPVSRFRQRSGSIGQALKSIGSGPKKADASAPPLPAIIIPPSSSSRNLDLQGLSAPPPLSPKSPRRSMASYSPFPSTDKRVSSANVGLGLRM